MSKDPMKLIKIQNATKILLTQMLGEIDNIIGIEGIEGFDMINILTSTYTSFTVNVVNRVELTEDQKENFIKNMICHFGFQLYEVYFSTKYRKSFSKTKLN